MWLADMNLYSFIIPVYNCENYIENCVASIMEIQLNYYEIILIDDGSSDYSGNVCDALSEKYIQVKCVHQDNQGVSSARNRGVKESSGKYVVFLDADDAINPDVFRDKLNLLEQDDSIDLLISGMSFDYYRKNKCYRREHMGYLYEGKMDKIHWAEGLYNLYLCNGISSLCNKVFKRSILNEYQLKLRNDMFLYEDLEFVLRYLASCNVIYNTPEVVYFYRQQEDEGNAGRRLKRIEHISLLVNQISDAFNGILARADQDISQEVVISNRDKILMRLYLILAREKIAVSGLSEIREICNEMSDWYMEQPEDEKEELSKTEQAYLNKILKGKAVQLKWEDIKVKLRHRVAVFVKSTQFYQWCRNR